MLLFVYKRVLDQILRLGMGRHDKAMYGYNEVLDSVFGSKVFVFPMPGTPCTAGEAYEAMSELAKVLQDIRSIK